MDVDYSIIVIGSRPLCLLHHKTPVLSYGLVGKNGGYLAKDTVH